MKTSHTNNTNLSHALALAHKGMYVFPLLPESKIPFGKKHKCKYPHINGHLDATTDEKIITTWFTEHPDANIGVNCERSGIVVIDPDRHIGKPDGLANLKKLAGKEKYLNTVIVKTGTCFHLWYKAPDGIEFNGNLCEEVQIKHEGYVLAPPSVHPGTKKPYTWYKDKSIFITNIANLPKWMYPHAVKSISKAKTEPTNGANRDDISDKEAESIARYFQQASMPPADAEQVIHNCAYLKHCVDDAEILSEPEWYHGIVGVLAFCENGAKAVHKHSAAYPKYSFKETQDKINHRLADGGPSLCKTLQEQGGNKFCEKCPFNKKIKSPIVLGYSNQRMGEEKRKPVTFPVGAFPAPVADYAIAAAKSIRCSADYCFAVILGLVAILVGNCVNIKITADWARYGSLWIAIVGRPGDKKSPALELCVIKPLKVILEELKDKFDKAKMVYDVELIEYRTEVKNWNKDKDNPEDVPIEPVKPYLEQIITTDTTVEALGELLERNSDGVGLVCDELSGFLRSMNQYKGGKGADRSHYLAMRNNVPDIINRKGKDPIYLDKPYVPIVGCLQPDTVVEVRKHEGMRQGTIDDGFLERINFSCPERCTDPPGSAADIPDDVKENFEDCVQKLFASRLLDDRTITLSEKARKRFIQAETEWHEAINSPDFNHELEAFYSKMPGQLGELILLIHEMKRAAGQTDSNVARERTVIAAKQVADYFLQHAQIASGIISKTSEERRVEQAVKWIKAKGFSVIQSRDLIAYKVAGVRKKTEAVSLMKAIADYGYGYLDNETGNLIFPTVVSRSAKNAKVKQE